MPENSNLKQSVVTNAEMLKFAGMSVFLGSVLLGTARRAYAAQTVTNTNDSGAGSLRYAINQAAATDTIQFAAGVTGTITLTSGEIKTNKALTITGPGSTKLTISGNNNSRIFNLYGGSGVTTSITGLTLTQGKLTLYTQGAGVFSNENLALSDVVISQCSGVGRGGGLSVHPGSSSTVTMTNCTISGNSGKYGAGAFLYRTNSTITNTTISGNKASVRGGGMKLYKGTATIDGCTISGNHAYGTGGAGLFLYKLSSVTVKNCTISGNNANNKRGGGLFLFSNTNPAIQNCNITNNQANYSGGGVYAKQSGTYVQNVTIQNTTISGSSAAKGAGIYQNNGTLAVTGSTISNNATLYGGGGGGYLSNLTVTIQSSTISNNTANINDGGGLYLASNTHATIQDSTFSGNHAGVGSTNDGGAVYLGTACSLTAQRCTFSGNTATSAGGAISTYSGPVTLENCTLTGNAVTGSGRGGGALNLLASVNNTIRNCTIANNSTNTGNGGGVYMNGTATGTMTITSSIIAKNTYNGVANDVSGTVVATSDHNLIGVNTGLTGISNLSNGNQIGTAASPIDPLLGALANNGGPTQTMALLAGSPAIDKGSNPANLTTDQRGTGFPRVIGTAIDIGSFERDTVPPTASLTSAPNVTTSVTTYTFTVTFADNIAVDVTTLGNSNILMTGPGGFSQLATFVSAAPNKNAASIVATYSLTTTTPLANGTYTIAIQATQVKDTTGNPVAAGNLGTFTVNVAVSAPATPPGFTSPPTATFQSATVGQPITFSAAGNGTISWDFGNGSTATGSTVTNVYTVPGTYIVTATLTDATTGAVTTQTLTLTINPEPIRIKRAHFALNDKDMATMSGFLQLTSNLNLAGQKAIVTIAGVSVSFTLDAHGKGKSGESSFALHERKTRHGGTFFAPFAVKFSGVPLVASFNANAPVKTGGIAQVPVLVQLGLYIYQGGTLRTHFNGSTGTFPAKQ
jgi:parallel beta-helix repeat protein/predicted outer membrane repeat protein